MTSRIYATLDRNRLGPLLLLDGSDLQITTAQACSGDRMVLGTMPAFSGDFAYELYFWSTSRASLADLISFGVATSAASIETFVGGDAESYGYLPANGAIYNNGLSIGTGPEVGERIALGCHLALSPSEATCEFLVSGSVVATADLPTGLGWYPAIGLGGTSAGDITAAVNMGDWRFDRLPWRNGWSQLTSGLSVITIALVNEAFQTTGADTPANTPFGPYVLNAGGIKISRSVRPRHLRDSSRPNPSSYTTLLLDNRDNRFAPLLAADVKDSRLTLQVIDAPAGGVGSIAAAETVMTGSVESVQRNRKGQIEVTLRGVISRLDRQMRMRRIAPFWDASSAGSAVPFGRGARRNVQPKLLDQPNRLYLLGDVAQTNVTLVSDQGAPLDPNALPPQWSRALDGEGIQLATDAVGRVSVDCSTVGQQYEIPGADDVLDDLGLFGTWGVADGITTTPPDGWLYSNNAGSHLVKSTITGGHLLRLVTSRPWYPFPFGAPPAPIYGDYVELDSEPLLGGRSYRLTFDLTAATANDPVLPNGLRGGFMVRTALSNDPRDAVTSHGIAIQKPSGASSKYTIDFTVPYGGPRSLYLIGTASSGATAGSATGVGYFDISNVRVELLGQFVSLPLDSIAPTPLLQDVLVDIEGEDPDVFNADDTDAIYAEAGYGIGIHKPEAPNLAELLQEIFDQYGAVVFEDEFDQIRSRIFRMPEDEGDVVAAFTRANVDLGSVRVYAALAPGLTTQYWSRPNCDPFADGDFVSDTDVVTPAMRAAFKEAGQYTFSSTVTPAREYIKRIGAGRQLLRIDELEPAKALVNRLVSQLKTKRMICEFTAFHAGMKLGVGPSVKPHKLYPVDKITVDLPDVGLPATTMRVLDTENQPLGGQILIRGIF